MAFPIRCFSCNKCIGQLEEKYFNMVESGIEPKVVFETLNVNRICCRRMFLGYVNIIDQLLLFSKEEDKSQESNPEN